MIIGYFPDQLILLCNLAVLLSEFFGRFYHTILALRYVCIQCCECGIRDYVYV